MRLHQKIRVVCIPVILHVSASLLRSKSEEQRQLDEDEANEKFLEEKRKRKAAVMKLQGTETKTGGAYIPPAILLAMNAKVQVRCPLRLQYIGVAEATVFQRNPLRCLICRGNCFARLIHLYYSRSNGVMFLRPPSPTHTHRTRARRSTNASPGRL